MLKKHLIIESYALPQSHESVLPGLRLAVDGGANFHEEFTAWFQGATGLLLVGLCQIYRNARPRFEDDVMMASPAAIVQPQPKAWTLGERKCQKKSLS